MSGKLVRIPEFSNTTHHIPLDSLAWAVLGHYGFNIDLLTGFIYDQNGTFVAYCVNHLAIVMGHFGWIREGVGVDMGSINWINMPHGEVEVAELLKKTLLPIYSNSGYSNPE